MNPLIYTHSCVPHTGPYLPSKTGSKTTGPQPPTVVLDVEGAITDVRNDDAASGPVTINSGAQHPGSFQPMLDSWWLSMRPLPDYA